MDTFKLIIRNSDPLEAFKTPSADFALDYPTPEEIEDEIALLEIKRDMTLFEDMLQEEENHHIVELVLFFAHQWIENKCEEATKDFSTMKEAIFKDVELLEDNIHLAKTKLPQQEDIIELCNEIENHCTRLRKLCGQEILFQRRYGEHKIAGLEQDCTPESGKDVEIDDEDSYLWDHMGDDDLTLDQ